jgi:hypothetical protein
VDKANWDGVIGEGGRWVEVGSVRRWTEVSFSDSDGWSEGGKGRRNGETRLVVDVHQEWSVQVRVVSLPFVAVLKHWGQLGTW